MVRAVGDLGVMGRLTAGTARNQAQAWADRTCAEQGLSAKISDRSTLATVAALLGADELDAPEGRQAGGVEEVSAADRGADRDMVKHRGNDRVLPSKRHRRPSGPQRGTVTEEAIKG